MKTPPITRFGILMVCSLQLSFHAVAASLFEVNRLDTERIGRDDTVRLRIELEPTRVNPWDQAGNPGFFSDVAVDFYVSFGSPRTGFSFFHASVFIVAMEQGESYYLDFFLPGVVKERDRLSERPFAYLIDLYVDGNRLAFDRSYASQNLSDHPEARKSLRERAAREAGPPNSTLLPAFLAPHYWIHDGFEHYPVYRRRDTVP